MADRTFDRGPEYLVDEETGCWICQRKSMTNGYCRVYRRGQGQHMAHRVYYEEHVGPIPDGLHIDHLCGERRCVNPAHLEAVTQAENNRRAGKLTAEDVKEIRSAVASYGYRIRLARQFGVSVSTIAGLRNGENWEDVDGG